MAFWGLPVFAAFLIGAPSLLKKRAPTAAPMAQLVSEAPTEKPILTRVITRPTAALASESRLAAQSVASPAALMALAFAPPERVARAQAAKADIDTMPTASMPRSMTIRGGGGGDRVATLRDVRVGDGLKIVGNGAEYELAGVQPLASDAMCRRLDGVEEACNQRAASRLEILTRGRIVTCQLVAVSDGSTTRGSCLAGKINLADDLVKNGLARRV
jgi:endonuclease YncB( thermonuclease family)